jgi:gamma-glutamyltranspeptidase/glutathione hydrolase
MFPTQPRTVKYNPMKKIYSLVFLILSLSSFYCTPTREVVSRPPADRHEPFDVVGTEGMVVAAHPLAAGAGVAMLKSGGNAIDAAVTTAFTLNVVEPFASGIGGGGFMVIYLAKENRVTVINFRERAPAAAYPSMFAEKGESRNLWRTAKGTAVAVPGALAGWNYALGKYGTRTLAQTMERATTLAEMGFPVSQTFSNINKDEYDKLITNAGTETCYLNDGIPFEAGETFRNPDLAATFRTISEKGIGEFYGGSIGEKLVAAVRQQGGIMTIDDLRNYRPLEVAPLQGNYKEYAIYTIPPPGSGGLHIIQLLQIAEPWPLTEWGQNSPPLIHHFSEALRYVFADHEKYLGDPEFVSVPVEFLTSKKYAEAVRQKISSSSISPAYPITEIDPRFNEKSNTTHLSVVDKDGNVVALTQSINDFFGTGIIPEKTGFLLNDQMDDFANDTTAPNAPNGLRRPVSSMSPLLLFKDGKPLLALGSPGGKRIYSSLTQIIYNIVEFGMPLDAAIEAPRFFTYVSGGKAEPLDVESRFPESTLDTLRKMGYRITVREPYDKYFGGAQGILIDGKGKRLLGGADSRRDGFGVGY